MSTKRDVGDFSIVADGIRHECEVYHDAATGNEVITVWCIGEITLNHNAECAGFESFPMPENGGAVNYFEMNGQTREEIARWIATVGWV